MFALAGCFLISYWARYLTSFCANIDYILIGDVVMPRAYVLITTESGSVDSVIASLKKMDSVKETYMVYGVYDVIALVEAETMEKLKEIVTWNLRSLDKVRSTLTMIAVEEQK